MARINPKEATLVIGGTIKITCQNGKVVRLRPGNKDPQAVCDDLNQRAKKGLSARVSDVSCGDSGDPPWYFRYNEKIKGHKRAQPDSDAAVLRDYEIRASCT